MASFVTSVCTNKDVVWQLLAQVSGFKGIHGKLYRQGSPALTSDENPGILFWKQAWGMTEMAQFSSEVTPSTHSGDKELKHMTN